MAYIDKDIMSKEEHIEICKSIALSVLVNNQMSFESVIDNNMFSCLVGTDSEFLLKMV